MTTSMQMTNTKLNLYNRSEDQEHCAQVTAATTVKLASDSLRICENWMMGYWLLLRLHVLKQARHETMSWLCLC